MKELDEKTLSTILGGKHKFNAGKCFTGTASGAISGAMGLSEFGIGGAVAGAVLSGGLAAWESCR